MDEKDIAHMLADPYYCIDIGSARCTSHKPLISKELWVQAGVKAIAEMGAEKYLTLLLETLESDEMPLGYNEYGETTE